LNTEAKLFKVILSKVIKKQHIKVEPYLIRKIKLFLLGVIMRKNSSEFITGFTSEAGTFRINKDYFAFVELDDVACYIAADGIDSDEEINSAQAAVNHIFELFLKKPSMSRKKIKRYILSAHKLLNNESKSVRLKVSLAVMVTDYSKMIWALAGNARLYHFRKGGFNFKSKDQSIAQIMADAGKISDDEIGYHEERNNLTNYLGQAKNFKPFVSGIYKLDDGDAVFLCTSGFWENMTTIDLVNALKDAKEPSEVIQTLEDDFLARQGSVVNNYTLACIFANKVFKENPKDNRQLGILKKAAAVLVPLIVIGAVFLIFRQIETVKARELFIQCEDSGDKYSKDGVFDKALEKYEEAHKSIKKAKDTEKEERIQKKLRIINLIVAGDGFFAGKEFESAQDYYINAKSQVEFGLQYEKTDLTKLIDDRINKTRGYIEALNISKSGDDESAKAKEVELTDDGTAKGLYANALKLYKKAKEQAEDIAFYDLKKEMEDKIKETEGKIKEIGEKAAEQKGKEEKSKKLVDEAKKFVTDGDKQVKAKKYEDAKYSYECAVEIYNELKDKYEQDTTVTIFDIKKKITQTEKLIEEQKIEAAKTVAP